MKRDDNEDMAATVLRTGLIEYYEPANRRAGNTNYKIITGIVNDLV